jgi:hypothetical protein
VAGVEEAGGQFVTGYVAKGPFHDAAERAKFVPIIDGGVEVRPLFEDPEAE